MFDVTKFRMNRNFERGWPALSKYNRRRAPSSSGPSALLFPPSEAGGRGRSDALMKTKVSDFTPVLRDAIGEIRSLGLTEAADELEGSISFWAYTTSTEWLGESGLAITGFLKEHRSQLPDPVVAKLTLCLTEICKVWRKYRP